MENQPIIEIEGTTGKISVYKDYLIISRHGLFAFATQGGYKGDRTIYYKDLTAIEYKKPSLVSNGYFQFILAGTSQTRASVGIFGSSLKSAKDENTIILRAFNSKIPPLSEKVNEILQERLKVVKSSATQTINTSQSLADEIAKLAELKGKGLLDDEEFMIAKQKLLKER